MFRLVFRPRGTGQAFFQLATTRGAMGLSSANPTGGPLEVPEGQEINIAVSVTTDRQGRTLVSMPPMGWSR